MTRCGSSKSHYKGREKVFQLLRGGAGSQRVSPKLFKSVKKNEQTSEDNRREPGVDCAYLEERKIP